MIIVNSLSQLRHYDFSKSADIVIHLEDEYAVAVRRNGNVIYKDTDHSQVIQRAIDSIESGMIFISAGKYRLNETINIGKPVSIVGAGNFATILECKFNGNCIHVGTNTNDYYGGAHYPVLANFQINGYPDATSDDDRTDGAGIYITRAMSPLLFNLRIARKQYGIQLARDSNGGLYNTYIDNVRLILNYTGIAVSKARVLYMHNVYGYLNKWQLMGVNVEYGLYMDNVIAEADGWGNTGAAYVVGISGVGMFDARITNLHVNGSKSGSLSPAKALLGIVANAGTNVYVRNIILQSANNYGMDVWGGDGSAPINVLVDGFLIGPLGSGGYMGDPGTVNGIAVHVALNDGTLILRNGVINANGGGVQVGAGRVRYEGHVVINGKLAMNGGIATFTGDGSTTQFTIEHGLAGTPSVVIVTPKGSTPKPDSVDWDNTYIYINYSTAPASGTTLTFSWHAEI